MLPTKSAGLVALALALLFSAAGMAAPVAESERGPLDLRRTTLIVRDIDASLAFYRDALGMTVVYDNRIRSPRSAKTDEEAERASRLVLLRANDDFIGMLGLLQYVKPVPEPKPVRKEGFTSQNIVLLFNAKDLDARWAKVEAAQGVEILSPPEETSYPSYDGKSVIRVRVSTLYDPDGFLVELNQLLTPIK